MSSSTSTTSLYNEFNSKLTSLFKSIKNIKSDKQKGKLYVSALHDKLIKLIRVDNTEPMKLLGPMIFECRDDIQEKNLRSFINKDYSAGLKEMSDKHNFTKNEYKDAEDAINYIKDIAVMATIDQTNEIFDIASDMLSIYVQYVIAEKSK
jgi:hypothetical protein